MAWVMPYVALMTQFVDINEFDGNPVKNTITGYAAALNKFVGSSVVYKISKNKDSSVI